MVQDPFAQIHGKIQGVIVVIDLCNAFFPKRRTGRRQLAAYGNAKVFRHFDPSFGTFLCYHKFLPI